MFAARGGFFYQQDTGPVSNIKFPASSIVPYYSNSAIPAGDWIAYTSANGRYIAGTTNPTLVGTVTSGRTASVNLSGVTTSAGSHNGSVPYTSGVKNTGGSFADGSNLSAGSHAHVGPTISFSDLKPDGANVRLLIATKDTTTIPAGTLAFRNGLTGSYGTALDTPGTAAYLLAGTSGGSISSGPGTATGYGSTSSNGPHRHSNTFNRQYFVTGPKTQYWMTNGEGSHSHSVTASMYQTLMSNTMVLKAWTSLIARAPATDVIVMYAGGPSSLTGTGWYLCDGTNNTLNINDYYVAAGGSWGSTYSSDAYVASSSIDAVDATHSHIANYNGAGFGITIWHDMQSWYHTHTLSASSFVDFVGSKFYLYFIQYKG
jgi:hypothetical protein